MDDNPKEEEEMKIDAALRSGENFVRVYYQVMDSSRHRIPSFYSPESNFVWNGHGRRGQRSIASFLEKLPPSTHKLKSISVQPLVGHHLLIIVIGTVGFIGRSSLNFQQTFTVINPVGSPGGKAFIASDSLRFIDGQV